MTEDINIPDRALYRADIIDELALNKHEAERFLQAFGHKQGVGRFRFIYQRELRMLQVEGALAEWVKCNCKPDRQTMSARKGAKA